MTRTETFRVNHSWWFRPALGAAVLVLLLCLPVAMGGFSAMGEVPGYLLLPGILAQTVLSLWITGGKGGFGDPFDAAIVFLVNWAAWFGVLAVTLDHFKGARGYWTK